MKHDHYYNYQEVTEFLQQMQADYPKLFAFESMGKTTQQRDIWIASITNLKTGAADSKPAFWIDANTHASEIAGTQCALYFINKILSDFGKNETATNLLDLMTFYVVPRLSADGAEFYLQSNCEVRSTPEPWPNPAVHENFIQKDMDQDGEVLLMRKKDPSGAFKISDKNNQLLVQRSHDDLAGGKTDYYKLYEEGEFQNFDGFSENFESVYGFDLNRQYPSFFRPEGQQFGAGPYPMFLPEAKALVKAFTDRHRIYGHITLHTYGGLVLKPSAHQPDEEFDFNDTEIYKKLLLKAAEVSGYKALSVYKDFRYHPREFISGGTDDWSFEQRGVFSFTIEIWDVWKQAGIDVTEDVARYFNPKEDELLRIFTWAQKNLTYKDFYQDWKTFQHPQLGEVEIGGWKIGKLFRNPPPQFLQEETEKVYQIILAQAKSLPLVKIKQQIVEKLANNLNKVTLILENQGYLPTYGSEQALKVKSVELPFYELTLNPNQKIISGKLRSDVPHLKGRSRFLPWHSPVHFVSRKNEHELKLEWMVQGAGPINFSADFARGGKIKTQFSL